MDTMTQDATVKVAQEKETNMSRWLSDEDHAQWVAKDLADAGWFRRALLRRGIPLHVRNYAFENGGTVAVMLFQCRNPECRAYGEDYFHGYQNRLTCRTCGHPQHYLDFFNPEKRSSSRIHEAVSRE